MCFIDLWPPTTAPAQTFTWRVPVNLPAPQGWQCPVCRAVWAPTMAGCGNCNRPAYEPVTGDTGTGKAQK